MAFFAGFLALLLSFIEPTSVASAALANGPATIRLASSHPPLSLSRTPIPFVDAYHDGYALVLWQDLSREELLVRLARIRKSGATHLIIPVFGCQTDIHSADVGSCEVAYRVSAQLQARIAIEAGFAEVSYLPIIQTLDWQWRGFFDPTDVEGWFSTYTTWIKRIAHDAQALGMKELVVGSELTLLYRYNERWQKLLAQVRTEFSGPLIVTVNWGDTEHSFWADADAIGVSAYYPLSAMVHPSQAELDAAWQRLHVELVALSQRWQRPIHITEVGYQSVSSAANTPWSGSPGDSSDLAVQARCFESFRKAWAGERALARANIWATEAQDPGLPSYLFSFETLGKPAEEVLARFFAERLAL